MKNPFLELEVVRAAMFDRKTSIICTTPTKFLQTKELIFFNSCKLRDFKRSNLAPTVKFKQHYCLQLFPAISVFFTIVKIVQFSTMLDFFISLTATCFTAGDFLNWVEG